MEQTRLKERVEQWLEEQLQVSCKVIRAWRMRSPKEEMIGLECESSEKWKEIMTNKSKLEGTDVYIEKDLTWQEREIRRKLVGFAKEQAGRGKKTLVRDTHAIIHGRIWRWNERENEPFQTVKEWKRTEASSREKNEDNIMEHSGDQKHQSQSMGIFGRI
ncbi:hypothetical protein QAD02_013588 [Eretmocerus hayati]|uniref:Uncharacterized protein n=1 Tax=Eretmocerus hayati TaxID=131215 RepID=A0ACC2P4P5_9HYME|nr:hypothetical protein QAD02_013588 [Eretmocerus hayati]